MKAGSLEAIDDLLDVLDQAVVFGVEDEVNGRKADVLVATAVAGDEMGVEQLVVVGDLRPAKSVAMLLPAMSPASACTTLVPGVAGLPSVSKTVPGTALCAMSFRNA